MVYCFRQLCVIRFYTFRANHYRHDNRYSHGPERRRRAASQGQLSSMRAEGSAREVTTSNSGVFTAANLTVGTYRVRVNAPGFAQFETANLILSANQVLNVDVHLSVASAGTSVQVRPRRARFPLRPATSRISRQRRDLAGTAADFAPRRRSGHLHLRADESRREQRARQQSEQRARGSPGNGRPAHHGWNRSDGVPDRPRSGSAES